MPGDQRYYVKDLLLGGCEQALDYTGLVNVSAAFLSEKQTSKSQDEARHYLLWPSRHGLCWAVKLMLGSEVTRCL